MKALVLKTNQDFENGSGWIVVQVVDDDKVFPVAEGLMWLDTELGLDDGYQYHYNDTLQQFARNYIPILDVPEGLTEEDINDLL